MIWTILGIILILAGLALLGLIIRKAVRGESDETWTKTRVYPHRDLPPRSPSRKKRGW